ncbi:LamG-like jellyroll fold domain-containing protein [Roseivirga thermotolerans]|nr:LamG-like jellyroll fold domain-containing protein [Roseivirga thermotolerans]
MKLFKSIVTSFALLLVLVGCDNSFIDEIEAVDPGADESAPAVTISYPTEGTQIQVYESVTSINIQFEVTDDIEVDNISVRLNDNEIVSYSDFKDYRRFVGEYLYEELVDGDHTLSIVATDIDGKTTTRSVNFSKVPPYQAKYDGEIFYMPFDGDNIELVSVTYPTEVGNMGFAGQGKVGGNALAGASGSYLTFPTNGLLEDEFSAVFWMKVNATPDRAGVLVIGPPDEANPTNPNNRKAGFRFFRENAGGKQRFKLNVGTGASDSWFDGGAAADVDPTKDEWVHMAFTISQSEATVYINGQVVKTGAFAGVDWTNCDIISIMSGAPRFTAWNHLSDQSFMDELRLFNKALSQTEIQNIIRDEGGNVPYQGEFGEIFYMPFDGNYTEAASGSNATAVGSPSFAGSGLRGTNAYKGAADSYLTFPSEALENDEFSASFWYKVNGDPDRAGILVIGPPDDANPTAQNKRTSGFRFFRENAGGEQRFKLNVGTGASDSWFDGGDAADVPLTNTDWIHMAFTISQTEAKVYINGQLVSEGTFDGIDWTDCDIMSIMSGAPRFTGWGHNADHSVMDELRIFDRVITQTEIQTIINAR